MDLSLSLPLWLRFTFVFLLIRFVVICEFATQNSSSQAVRGRANDKPQSSLPESDLIIINHHPPPSVLLYR